MESAVWTQRISALNVTAGQFMEGGRGVAAAALLIMLMAVDRRPEHAVRCRVPDHAVLSDARTHPVSAGFFMRAVNADNSPYRHCV